MHAKWTIVPLSDQTVIGLKWLRLQGQPDRKSNLFCFFSRYVPKNLLEVLEEKSGGVDPELVRKLIFQLVTAIAWCHQHDIIHRDIKVSLAAPPLTCLYTLAACVLQRTRNFTRIQVMVQPSCYLTGKFMLSRTSLKHPLYSQKLVS